MELTLPKTKVKLDFKADGSVDITLLVFPWSTTNIPADEVKLAKDWFDAQQVPAAS